jgi:hypothetical protein
MIERVSAVVNQPGLQATHLILVDYFLQILATVALVNNILTERLVNWILCAVYSMSS